MCQLGNFNTEFSQPDNNRFSPIKNKGMTMYDEDSKLKIVSTLTTKQFSCVKCDKSFSSQVGLRNHTESVHDGVR